MEWQVRLKEARLLCRSSADEVHRSTVSQGRKGVERAGGGGVGQATRGEGSMQVRHHILRSVNNGIDVVKLCFSTMRTSLVMLISAPVCSVCFGNFIPRCSSGRHCWFGCATPEVIHPSGRPPPRYTHAFSGASAKGSTREGDIRIEEAKRHVQLPVRPFTAPHRRRQLQKARARE